MVPDGRTDGMDGRTDEAKTISLRLRRGIIKCVRTEKQCPRSVCNYMQCHCVPFSPFRFHLGNKQMPVGYCFFYFRGHSIIPIL